MRFRDITPDDLLVIRGINSHPEHGYDLDSPEFVLGGVVVDDDNRIVGFGGVKVIYEPVLILDFNRDKKTRIQATRELLAHGIQRSVAYGINHWHVFCDTKFASFLVRWFDFVPVNGTALILDIEGGSCVETRRKTNAREAGSGSLLGEEYVWGVRPGTSTRASSST